VNEFTQKALLLTGVAFILIIGISVLYAFPVMWFWNWLMPEIFGLKQITLMQAWGLSFLSGLLIKSPSISANS
jgi:hypothetical protein